MRIIGGEFGGRRLLAPAGAATRPTADRVREALFNILGPPPAGARVLDLCAGAGTLGLEALSRGAAHATFVDSARAAITALRENIARLDVGPRCQVLQSDVIKAVLRLAKAPAPPFWWIFIDPPYRTDLATLLVNAGATKNLLAADGLVIIEHNRQNPAKLSATALLRTDHRRYGDTELSFYRHAMPSP